MLPNSNVFCNTPWYELQIYWDGSLGVCCQESHKLYPAEDQDRYNIRSMSIQQWINSDPVRNFRQRMFDQSRNSACSRCYYEEDHGGISRRIRSNQKSVIFTKSNFSQSYQQSPGFKKFEDSRKNQGQHQEPPIDIHVDLGNYCNLTCKMCYPAASSSIASQYVKWGNNSAAQYIGNDWTRNKEVWQRFLQELASFPNLHNVHFMGGETLISSKFEEFVDYMLSQNKLNLNFSFVTNGTMFRPKLLEKLSKFQRVGIEVSIESLTKHNDYTRQGTDTVEVLNNIKKYMEFCNGSNITLTVRPAISALTIGSYWTLLQYCLDQKLLIKSLIVSQPTFYDIRVLPHLIRQHYIKFYQDFLHRNQLESGPSIDYNQSDPNQYRNIIVQEVEKCINLLLDPGLDNQDQLLQEMVNHCKKWDQVHGYNARVLYPEWIDLLNQYGY